MDISMPVLDGESTSREAIELFPDLKIIALSMFSDAQHYQLMVSAGVKGFMIKEARLAELRRGIYEVYEGGTYFSQVLLQNIISSITDPDQGNHSIQLTERENEVLKLICKGLTNKEISEEIFVSVKTVEGYKTKLLEKTDTKNSINLMLYAVRNGLIDLDA
jgi:DNA-binding NarL/FixJ family response regulator